MSPILSLIEERQDKLQEWKSDLRRLVESEEVAAGRRLTPAELRLLADSFRFFAQEFVEEAGKRERGEA